MAEIDARIPLMVQTPQVPNVLDQYSKLMALKNLGQQNQMQSQAMQENDMKLQQMRQDATDQATARQILSDSGGDFNVAKPKLLQALGGKAVPLIKNIMEQESAMTKLSDDQRKAAAEKMQTFSSAIDDTFAAPPEQRQAIWQNKLQMLVQGGAIPQEKANSMPQWDDEAMQGYGSVLKQTQNSLDMKAKQAAQEKADQDLIIAKQTATGTQPITLQQKEANKPASLKEFEATKLNPGYDKWLTEDANRKRQVNNFNTTIPGLGGAGAGANAQLTGDNYLKSLPPATAAQIRAISEGKDNMPPASSRQPSAIALRQAVYQYDPDFTIQRAQIRKAFTAGKDGTNIGNVNTAIVHLGRLAQTAQSLKNGSFTPGNELFNYFKDKFGSETVTNFGLLKDAVAGEMAAALKGTATDIEIEKMGKSIRAANSPQQMLGVVTEGMGILKDKANTFDERFHAIAPDDPWSPILPSAKQMLTQYGVKSAGVQGASGFPKKGESKSYMGANYVFDGTKWVKK